MVQELKITELQKINAVREKSQAIGEFLDWLSQKNYSICELRFKTKLKIDEAYFPIHKSIEKWIAEYFDIDLEQAEKERVKILEDFREEQKKKS